MPHAKGRVSGYDVLRGFSVVSMVLFHLCYDLVYLKGVALPWFASPFQDVWRASISWVFLLIAGIMCSYSRDNLRRAGCYLALAVAIFCVTLVAVVDTPISFGIIYCMGASTLLAWGLSHLGLVPAGTKGCLAAACALAALFLLCLEVPQGRFGLGAFGGPSVGLPRLPYESGLLSWLGFPGPTFASGDYYPPLPYSLLFLAGACAGRLMRLTKTPAFLTRLQCRPLEWVGRHALVIYAAHQPLLLLAYGLI